MTGERNPTKPGARRRLWEGWKRAGRKIGDFQARLLLTLFYFLILAPFALILRLAADPLGIKTRAHPAWRARPAPLGTAMERAQRQF
jgi:hypothetical protein